MKSLALQNAWPVFQVGSIVLVDWSGRLHNGTFFLEYIYICISESNGTEESPLLASGEISFQVGDFSEVEG